EVAVVAVPSSMGEDDARCSVVLADGATLTAEGLVDWALERLAPFKVPRYVEFVAELPRTATKAEIDRPALASAGTAGCYDRVGNVNVMSLANNHVMDAGAGGLMTTIEVLDELGIRSVGAGRDLDEARRAVVLERRGVRTAFVAAASTFPAGIEAKRGRAGINPLRFHNHYYLAEGDLEFNPGVTPEVMVIPWPQDIEAMQ